MFGLRTYASLAAAITFAGVAGAQDITVFVNGEPVSFQGIGARQMQGRVLVPLRGVMERLGAYVSYLPESKTVIATKGDVDLQLRLGDRMARLNGREVFLDVPAQAYSGSTLVPLRFMSEALGAQVSWDAPAMAVRITTPTSGTGNTGGATQPIARPFEVTSFGMDRDASTLRAGDRVTFTLEGTPGAQAVMQIPGLTEIIRMAEVAPGRYQAIVTVPDDPMTVSRANAIARLTYNGQEKLIQAGAPLMVDTQAPTILYPMPEGNSRITDAQPNISFNFEDLNGTGIDRDRVRIWLDGTEVTREATIGASTVFFRPRTALSPGDHVVKVEAIDRAGNRAEREWRFNVALSRQVFQSFTHNGARGLQPGQVVRFEVVGEPGGRVSFQIGEKVTNIPAREVSPGRYVGEYTVRLEDDLRGEQVTARLRAKDNEVYTLQAPQLIGEIRAPRKPTITSPSTGTRAVSTNTVNIQGKAARRARVLVRVDYTSTLFGVFGSKGTIFEKVVIADQEGNWQTGDIRIDNVGTGSGTEYTVTAKVVGANGVESEAVTHTFKR